MLVRELSISSKQTIVLNFKNQPFFESEKCLIFGYPFNFTNDKKEMPISTLVHDLKGYWLIVEIESEEIRITTDILGGYRVYYSQKNDSIYVSDDFLELENILDDTSINSIELEFWEKHRFTTGKGTFLNEIAKVSPSSTLKISKNGISEISYFKNVVRKSDAGQHMKIVNNDLEDSFNHIENSKKKVILMFSGGKDSCLLLQYLKERSINFELLFFKISPVTKMVAADLTRARNVASKLKIDLKEIDIDLTKITEKEKYFCVKQQILDRHYSILHYFGMKMIKDIYGTDVIIINGQSSDSILSFGPSENSLMSYFRREMMYFPSSFLSRLGLFLLSVKSRKRFKLPTTIHEKLLSLFDEFKYSRVLEIEKSAEYHYYLEDYIKQKTDQFSSYESKEMYTKILSFCQGSDNQVVVNSANYYSLKVIMPFATPEIIYGTVKYKDEHLEVKRPKYVVDDILLEKYHFNYLDLMGKSNLKENKVKGKVNVSNVDMDLFFMNYISKHYKKNDSRED